LRTGSRRGEHRDRGEQGGPRAAARAARAM